MVKKIIGLSVFFSMLTVSAANAWYIQVDNQTGFDYVESSGSLLNMEVHDFGYEEASWAVDSVSRHGNRGGGVDVTYMTSSGYIELYREFEVQFQIISDDESVDVIYEGEGYYGAQYSGDDVYNYWVPNNNIHISTSDSFSSEELNVFPFGGHPLDTYGQDDFSTQLTLMTNTQYTISGNMAFEIWVDADESGMQLPSHFDSWGSFADFINHTGGEGELYFDVMGDVNLSIQPVPVPASLLLLGAGLLALVGVKRKS